MEIHRSSRLERPLSFTTVFEGNCIYHCSGFSGETIMRPVSKRGKKRLNLTLENAIVLSIMDLMQDIITKWQDSDPREVKERRSELLRREATVVTYLCLLFLSEHKPSNELKTRRKERERGWGWGEAASLISCCAALNFSPSCRDQNWEEMRRNSLNSSLNDRQNSEREIVWKSSTGWWPVVEWGTGVRGGVYGGGGHGVRLYRRRFKRNPSMEAGGLRIAFHYKELSLWIAQVHLDTAARLHLAPCAIHLITPCPCTRTYDVYTPRDKCLKTKKKNKNKSCVIKKIILPWTE